MSIFGSEVRNLDYSPAINVEEAAGYDDGVHSAQIAQIEGLQNHLALFEGGIKTDIQAAYMVSEGVGEEEVFAFSESVIGDMLKRIKEFFMKLWAKIKAIFKGFMARIDSMWIKSNKDFINKYKKDIIGKDLTDFEVTYRKLKKADALSNIMDFNDLSGKATAADLVVTTKGLNAEEHDKKFDAENSKEKLLGAILLGSGKTVEEKEFEKEAFDKIFEDEESNEVSQSEISTIMTRMLGFKEARKGVKKEYDDINKAMSYIVKEIEKGQNEVWKNAPDKDGAHEAIKHKTVTYGKTKDDSSFGDESGNENDDKAVKATNDKYTAKGGNRGTELSNLQRGLGILSRSANIVQSCVLKATSVSLKIYDFSNKQDRKVLAKAVAYKHKKDESVMMEAFAELADWEADVSFA